MILAEFHFLRPWWFLALLPTLALLVMLAKHRKSAGAWQEICDPELLPYLLADKPSQRRRNGAVPGSLMALLTITALAGPTWQRLPSPAFRNESALVIALNLSASMDAGDIKPSRVSKARYKIADLLKLRKDGQTALLVYGGDAFTVTPLTSDVATINSQLEALTTDIMPSSGLDTGKAIRKAVNLLRQAGAASGDILLVTDGCDPEALAAAKELPGAYRLSVLAIGTSEGAPVKQAGGGFIKDASGGIVIAKLDLGTLQELSGDGKGMLQTITTGDDDVNKLAGFFDHQALQSKTEESNLLLQRWDDKGPWLLLPVLAWAALRFRKGLLTWAGLLLLLPLPQESQALDWHSLWHTPDQQGSQAFEQQQYQQAAGEFANPQWRAAAQYRAGAYQQAAETLKDEHTADGDYNRGNALAQAGRLQEAVDAYNRALAQQPDHQDAQFNKTLVEKKLKEQQQNQQNPQQENNPENRQQQNPSAHDESPQQSAQKPADQDQSAEQSQDGQKPSQAQQNPKPDQSAESSENNAQQQAGQNAQHPQPEKPQAGQPQEQSGEQQRGSPQDRAASAADKAKAELDRTDEQLLKRIPDEPTGLLKRKFKYQYNQHQSE